MRYAQLRSMDVSNGEGIGVSLFVQGCSNHCEGCFNSETWDFNGGQEWTPELENTLISLLSKPGISRLSVLGGEPLAPKNYYPVYKLLERVKTEYPNIKVWLYTGYEFEHLSREQMKPIFYTDVLVDGPFIEEQKDLSLKFRGSRNQRLINVKETMNQDKIVLWGE